MDVILNRRSIRKYDLSKKIPYEDLLLLCKYAESAPSARRQKGRAYIIIDDQAIIQKLALISKGASILAQCNTAIAVVAVDPKNLPTPNMQVQDLSAATQNILLAATQMNLGSCWIGVSPIEDRVQQCDEILKLKGDNHVFSIVSLGYPVDEKSFYELNKLEENMIYHNEYH